jgi:hypothetical protein
MENITLLDRREVLSVVGPKALASSLTSLCIKPRYVMNGLLQQKGATHVGKCN